MKSPALSRPRPIGGRSLTMVFSLLAMFLAVPNVLTGQVGNGSTDPASADSANRADSAIRGSARVNPRTLALEFSVSLMSYPGRNKHGVQASLDYSSKVWRMAPGLRWWYQTLGGRRYVTDVNARFSERTAGGWTSGLAAPLLETRPEFYDDYGNRWGDPFGSASAMDTLWAEAAADSSGLMPAGNFQCVAYDQYWCPDCRFPDGTVGAHIYVCTAWEIGPGVPEPPELPSPPEEGPPPLFYAARVYVSMPGGARHEFRRDDERHACGIEANICSPDLYGTFLSTDGTRMRLERSAAGSVLFLPNGSRYEFPPNSPSAEGGVTASRFVDVNGNFISYTVSGSVPDETRKVVDTLGREITDPIPRNGFSQTQVPGTERARLPWFGGGEQSFDLKWSKLKPVGCEDSTDPDCADGEGNRGGALEDQSERLHFDSRYFCRGSQTDDLSEGNGNPVLFSAMSNGIRACSAFRPGDDGQIQPVRFNPVVLEEIALPNGRKYVFKYNRYGEISKIVYPTGVYEEFVHSTVSPVGGTGENVFDQANRGVVERRIYSPDGQLQQRWKYQSAFAYSPASGGITTVTSVVSKPDDATVDGAKTEMVLTASPGDDSYGFRDPAAGSVREIRKYDSDGALVSRTLFDWEARGPVPGGQPNARRDLRKKRSVEFTFEPGETKALGVMTHSEFDEDATVDPSHFAHLNDIRSMRWKYTVFDAAQAATVSIAQAASVIEAQTEKASDVARGFKYDPEYRDLGLAGIIEYERVLDPTGSGAALNETRFEYDSPEMPLIDPGTPVGWQDPGTSLRGNISAIRKLNTANGEWLTEKFQYDKFGNTRVTWDASGVEERHTKIEYSGSYEFAYPVAISLPAPDPSGERGSAERSVTAKTYDRTTGLLLSVTDLQVLASPSDDRTTLNSYEDPLLRITQIREPSGAVREISYQDGEGVSKIITSQMFEPGRWSRSESEYDGFGRVIATMDLTDEGVSVIRSEYDLHGRMIRRSTPHFQGADPATVAWFRTDFDASGRARRRSVEQAGAPPERTSDSTFGIASPQGSIGRSITTTDGSGRSRREVLDSLGRIARADEAVSATGDPEADLGPVNSPAQPTRYFYSKRGELVEIRQGVQRRLFAWDAFGRMIRQKLPEQESNPDLAFADPETGNSSWSAAFDYDQTGNLVRVTNANGTVTESLFDRNDRLIKRTFSDGTPGIDYRYDLIANGKGEIIEVSNAVSRTRVTAFDNAGRPTAYEQVTAGQQFISSFDYTLTGEIKRTVYPSGRSVDQEFGSDGRLRRVSGNYGTAEAVYANSFAYGPEGKTRSIRLGNGRWESAEFSAQGRLSSIGLGAFATDASVWRAGYSYGETLAGGEIDPERINGSVASIEYSTGAVPEPFVHRFRYDALGRLSEAVESQGGTVNWSQEFSYDRFGNRTSVQQDLAGVPSSAVSVFDPFTNRFLPASGHRYDRNGNVIRDSGGRNFIYDGTNRQSEIRSPDGLLVGRYSFDGLGRRVMAVTPLVTTVFVYAGEQLVAEYSTRPPTNPKTRYLTTDHIGSTRVVTDGSGTVLDRRDHMPFGEDLVSGVGTRTEADGFSPTTSSVRPGFAGYLADPETGLGYAEARMYDGSSGRFTSVDPMLGSSEGADPRTLNRYTYTLNDPVNLSDPDGLAVVDDWYVKDDGKIEVYRTEDPFDRFYVFDENRNVFVLVAQLDKNAYGLVRFPNSGYGFTNYNPGERGGYDPNTGENVGQGDHYLLPVTAAALFGLTNQLKNDHGITLALGDMSSSNGSDPWDSRYRSATWDGHHATHGHKGNGTGLSIDFRYVDSNGRSRQGNWADNPSLFSKRKNQAVFDLARKWGFSKSLRGYKVPVRHTRAAGKHNDHGHLGFDLRKKKPKRIYQDRRKYYIRWSDVTLDCLVDQCVR